MTVKRVSVTVGAPPYNRLYPQARLIHPLRMLPVVDAFQQHRQLCRCQMDFAVSRHRPDEATVLQAFGEQSAEATLRKGVFIGADLVRW